MALPPCSSPALTYFLLPPQDDDDDDDVDLDSDDEALRYEAELEEQLEESYTEYLQRRGKREELIKVSVVHLIFLSKRGSIRGVIGIRALKLKNDSCVQIPTGEAQAPGYGWRA